MQEHFPCSTNFQGPYSAIAAYISCLGCFSWTEAALYTDRLFILNIYAPFLPHYGTMSYLPASGSSVLEVECVFEVELHKQWWFDQDSMTATSQGMSRCK